jgi:hypothetical protein
MPLKRKIRFHFKSNPFEIFCADLSHICKRKFPQSRNFRHHRDINYLSPAPQALPQAAGFSSGAAAPQAAGASVGSAAPQAAGASAGLSPAPQAEPHDDALLFHSAMFESAIIITSLRSFDFFRAFSFLCNYSISLPKQFCKYLLFYYIVTFLLP